jgi:hypothetical protein
MLFNDVFFLSGNNINAQAILSSYPCYSGGSISGVPIIDMTVFLSYFKTNKMTFNAYSGDNKEMVDEYIYYSNEEEFCNNFLSYLLNPPSVKETALNLIIEENCYKQDNFPEIRFMDINPKNEKSRFVE